MPGPVQGVGVSDMVISERCFPEGGGRSDSLRLVSLESEGVTVKITSGRYKTTLDVAKMKNSNKLIKQSFSGFSARVIDVCLLGF